MNGCVRNRDAKLHIFPDPLTLSYLILIGQILDNIYWRTYLGATCAGATETGAAATGIAASNAMTGRGSKSEVGRDNID